MPIRLHVNVDHVATLRNARGERYPDPVFAAQLCERAGADGITVHLREDRRHIVDRDVERLREAVQAPLNLEIGATDEMVAFALKIRPEMVTLVPERREERTTEGGLEVAGQQGRLSGVVGRLRELGIVVSLFIAPDLAQLEATIAVGAAEVELHTGEYCHASGGAVDSHLARLRRAAQVAHGLGLKVAAGHGLHLHNLHPICQIPELAELNIGHALIADALFDGLETSVSRYRAEIARGSIGRAGVAT